ncbi:hypothetical protein BIV57_03825 [Mangrovactinospora gilvigrisea]|uniref:Uncharacterized protein n=1 Tax=Mangrovactinospora gilvigrisea TaxID=1428644 RepID=A0A1J7BZG6_9ACTN|nr:hypothetical protein [Mangrovactinospora gilvigrisea]OIV38873.1 hypothetical protein BIV57_03825 [Mangrovactinospora gilvigrisea]
MVKSNAAGRRLKVVFFELVVLVLLVSGFWMGVKGTQDATGSTRVRGSMAVAACSTTSGCTGTFTPDRSGDSAPRTVRISTIAAHKGEKVAVALRPGTNVAVRTGVAGFLLAWVVFGGALLLGGLLLRLGAGLPRPAGALALAGAVVLGAAWLGR